MSNREPRRSKDRNNRLYIGISNLNNIKILITNFDNTYKIMEAYGHPFSFYVICLC